MFIYTIIYITSVDFDGSLFKDSFSTSNRAQALDWMKSDRFLDLQVTHDTYTRAKAEPSAYDEIAF